MAHWPKPLLLGVGRHRWSDYKNLVRGKRSVRQLLSRYIDSIALGKCHLFWCDFHDGDIWRHGDRLRAVLILDHQGGAAAFCTVPFVMRECDTGGRETEPLVILLWVVAPGGSVRTLPSAAPRSSSGNMMICFATSFPSACSVDATPT